MNKYRSENKSPEDTMPVGGAPITPTSKTVLTGIAVLAVIILPIAALYYGTITP
jgi:hypothetical protein